MKVEIELSFRNVLLCVVVTLVIFGNGWYLGGHRSSNSSPPEVDYLVDHRVLSAVKEQAATLTVSKHPHTGAVNTHHLRNAAHVPSAAYQCSLEEMLFQHKHTPAVILNICSDTAWELAQLLYPDANMFFDIGGNRGYTAARFFGLWSPGSEINRQTMLKHYEDAVKLKLLKNNEQITTFCGDGGREDKQLYCAGRVQKGGGCQYRRNITVHSFDGQLTHFDDAIALRNKYYPQLHPSYKLNRKNTHTKATWHYHHLALTDSFEDNITTGYFHVVHHETGKLVKKNKDSPAVMDGHIEVNISTVDHFCNQHRIDKVDFLKVDAEGADIDVLKGASFTLKHRNVKMLTFECFDCLNKLYMPMVNQLNVEFGYDCYMYGASNVVVRVTNCMDRKHQTEAEGINSIMHCVKRQSVLHYAFENLSMLRYFHDKRGDLKRDALLNADNSRIVNTVLVE